MYLIYILLIIIVSFLFLKETDFEIKSVESIEIEGFSFKKFTKTIGKEITKQVKAVETSLKKEFEKALDAIKKLAIIKKESEEAKRLAEEAKRLAEEAKKRQKYIDYINELYTNSTNYNIIKIILISLKTFLIDNHQTVFKTWYSLKPVTRTYLKETWGKFINLKNNILNDINTRNPNAKPKSKIESSILSTSSSDSFTLETIKSTSSGKSVESDFSNRLFQNMYNKFNLYSTKESFVTPETVNSYIVSLNDTADYAYFQNNDKWNSQLQSIDKFYHEYTDQIKMVIDGLNRDSTNGGQTLGYVNENLNYFYKILNTFPLTDVGKIVN